MQSKEVWLLADLVSRLGTQDFIISGPSQIIRELTALPWLDGRTDRTHVVLQSTPVGAAANGFTRVVIQPFSSPFADVEMLQPTAAELSTLSIIRGV